MFTNQNLTPVALGFPAVTATSLPADARERMEGAFGIPLGGVPIFVNSFSVPPGALSVVQGGGIHFAPGRFAPDTPDGQRLLALAIAALVQQRDGGGQPFDEAAARLAAIAAMGGAASMHVLPSIGVSMTPSQQSMILLS